MTNLTRGISLGMTTAAVAAIIVVTFLWVGPGAEAFSTKARLPSFSMSSKW